MLSDDKKLRGVDTDGNEYCPVEEYINNNNVCAIISDLSKTKVDSDRKEPMAYMMQTSQFDMPLD